MTTGLIEPVEIPVGGAYVQHGYRVRKVADTIAQVTEVPQAAPARGYVVITGGCHELRGFVIPSTTLTGAREVAVHVAQAKGAPVVLGERRAACGPTGAYLVQGLARYEPATSEGLIARAVAAAQSVRKGIQLLKAPPKDPMDPRVFDAMVADLGDTLTGRSEKQVRAAVTRTMGKTKLNWSTLDASGAATFNRELARQLGVAADTVWTAVKPAVVRSAEKMAVATASSVVRRQDLGIGLSLALEDKAAVARAALSQGAYIKDFYTGQMADQLSASARSMASQGIREGLGSEEIGVRLHRQLGNKAAGLNQNYMQVFASAINGRSRTFSALSQYSRAGVQRYRVDSVLDDNTTDTCRWLDGKTFSVGSAMQRHQQIDGLSDPMAVRYVAPWTRERLIKSGPNAGKKGIYIPRADGGLTQVAVIEQSAYGTADAIGSYSSRKSDRELMEAGLGFPPYHGFCRTTVSAV
jgi:hypothetical protein